MDDFSGLQQAQDAGYQQAMQRQKMGANIATFAPPTAAPMNAASPIQQGVNSMTSQMQQQALKQYIDKNGLGNTGSLGALGMQAPASALPWSAGVAGMGG